MDASEVIAQAKEELVRLQLSEKLRIDESLRVRSELQKKLTEESFDETRPEPGKAQANQTLSVDSVLSAVMSLCMGGYDENIEHAAVRSAIGILEGKLAALQQHTDDFLGIIRDDIHMGPLLFELIEAYKAKRTIAAAPEQTSETVARQQHFTIQMLRVLDDLRQVVLNRQDPRDPRFTIVVNDPSIVLALQRQLHYTQQTLEKQTQEMNHFNCRILEAYHHLQQYDTTTRHMVSDLQREIEKQKLLNVQLEKEKHNLQESLRDIAGEIERVEKARQRYETEMVALQTSTILQIEELEKFFRRTDSFKESALPTQKVVTSGSGGVAPSFFQSPLGKRMFHQHLQMLGWKYNSDQTTQHFDNKLKRLRHQLDVRQYSTRNDRLATVYAECFAEKGLTMIWEAIQLVFATEYRTPLMVLRHEIEAAEQRFKADFNQSIVAAIATLPKLPTPSEPQPTLRDLYVVECNALRCKPNSVVLKMFQSVPRGSGISENSTSLDVSSTLLGDMGCRAVINLLDQMPRLTQLSFARNGLRDGAVSCLVKVLMKHPSITSLDLSGNPISRPSGKELLQLLGSNPRLRVLEVEETNLERATYDRIVEMLELRNRCR